MVGIPEARYRFSASAPIEIANTSLERSGGEDAHPAHPAQQGLLPQGILTTEIVRCRGACPQPPHLDWNPLCLVDLGPTSRDRTLPQQPGGAGPSWPCLSCPVAEISLPGALAEMPLQQHRGIS